MADVDPQTVADAAARRLRGWLDSRTVRDPHGQDLRAVLDGYARMATELEVARADSRDAYIASLFSEPVECECGCQPGQPCDCSLADCECIGDCPVCDADGMTYTLGKDPAR